MKTSMKCFFVPVGAGLLMFLIVVGAGWARCSGKVRVSGIASQSICLDGLVHEAEKIRELTGSYPTSLQDLREKAKGLGEDLRRIEESALEEGTFIFEIVNGEPRATWIVPPEIRRAYSLPERLTEPGLRFEELAMDEGLAFVSLPLVSFSAFVESEYFRGSIRLGAATALATAGLWFLCVGRSRSRRQLGTLGAVSAGVAATVVALAAAMVIMELHIFPRH